MGEVSLTIYSRQYCGRRLKANEMGRFYEMMEKLWHQILGILQLAILYFA